MSKGKVPENIFESRELVSIKDEDITWQEGEDGYKFAVYGSKNGDIALRWLIVFSDHAYTREEKTLEKNLKTKEEALVKFIWHFGKKNFGCKQDTESKITALRKPYPLYHVHGEIVPVLKYVGRGKPRADEAPEVKGYKVDLVFE